MNYFQAMEFLEGTKKYGSRLGLDSIRNLMNELGNVQNKIPVIHIAGTNGKGSVGAMLSSALCQAGYQVCRFSTPDVFSYEEEFLKNGVPIARERLAQLFTEVERACIKMTSQGHFHPTRFEVETAAAYLWFWEERCDAAIVEVGMGGETDATNVVEKPVLSILTSISMDHMKFLGGDLAQIAGVKAGIIKSGCPVVTVRQKEEAAAIIKNRCRQTESPCVCADVSTAGDITVENGNLTFSWKSGSGEDGIWREIRLGLGGWFQIENAVCALESLKLLNKKFSRLTESSVRAGLFQVQWRGRFEKIGSEPDFYLDGAHNEDAVEKLRKTLDIYFSDRKIIYIMGVLADKEYSRMISVMFHPGDRVFTVTPQNPRALDGKELARQLKEEKTDALYCESGTDAVLCALREAEEQDVILAFGSLSYLREIRQAYEKISGENRERKE